MKEVQRKYEKPVLEKHDNLNEATKGTAPSSVPS